VVSALLVAAVHVVTAVSSTTSLTEARDLHLQHLFERRLQSGTLGSYSRVEQGFLDFLTRRGIPPALEALNPRLLEQYEASGGWDARGHKDGRDGLGARRSILKAWGRFLWQRQLLKSDPFETVRSKSLLEAAQDGGQRARSSTELGQTIEACMTAALVEGISPATIDVYGDHLRALLRYACDNGFTTPASITPVLVRAAAAVKLDPAEQRNGSKGGEASAKMMINAARYFSKWSNAQGTHMPDLSAVKAPRVPQRIQPRVTPDEFRALEQAVVQRLLRSGQRLSRFTIARDLALLSLLGDTGLRAAEVCALDIDDLNLEQGSIQVRRGKGGKGRALCILDPDPAAVDGGPTLQALRSYLNQRALTPRADETPALWISYRGRRLSYAILRSVLERICRDAGLNGNRPPHAFRRANFTAHYLADPDGIRVLAARMGWSEKSHEMIATYTRGSEVELARTQPRPSVTRQWRGDAALPRVSPQRGHSQVVESKTLLSPELIAMIRNDPALVRTLLEALGGAA
jgi:site-specific recombinase XerC